MRKTFLLFFALLMVNTIMMAGANDLLWDYTSANIPTSGPDNGLYYASYVNDAAGTNLGLHGVKLNSSGYAYFEKAAVPGTLRLTFSNRKTATEYCVDVCHGSLVNGTPTKGALIATSAKTQGPETVSLDLDATVTGVYICRNTSAEGVLCKIEFIETVARNFTNFEMVMASMSAEYDFSSLPADVSASGTFSSDQHGYRNFTITVPVDGTVKFTIGDCRYGNQPIAVKNHAGATIASLTYPGAECYGASHPEAVFTYLYVGGADTLTFGPIQYCNYFAAEATEVRPATLTYRDQNGNVLAKYDMYEGDAIGEVPDSLNAKLTIPEGMAFRGWKYPTMALVKPTDALTGNTTITAHVTPIEHATVGSHYKFTLNSSTDYMTDHEMISATGSAAYHDSKHGWCFQNGAEMLLVVSPKAYVSVGLCEESNTSDQIIRNQAGDSVATMHVVKKNNEGATADGALCSFYYANTANAVDTLHFVFTTTSYIHSVEVYNVAAPLTKVGHVYDVESGDAGSLMMACAALQDGDTIRLHDGIYDFGETCLTSISANRITVIGESMNGTIIKNAPDAKIESIDKTATILNTGTGNVFENLTIQNALDYYKANNGRAVCLWDKGDKTACYNVRLLSYQDTYYSNKPGQQCWFEDCEIHGTVDFICGSGSVYFYNTLLFCEKRNANGGGSDCITASNSQTARGDKGYVFDRCTIQSECPTVSLSRTWNDQPQVAFLLTTLDMSKGNFSLADDKIQRWTISGMNNCDPYDFSEYSTMDAEGNVVSPASNVVNFWGNADKAKETIIGYEAAEAKTYTHFFTDWAPARNYVAFPAPMVDALDEVEAESVVRKFIIDGQIVIERDGIRYNALGQKM